MAAVTYEGERFAVPNVAELPSTVKLLVQCRDIPTLFTWLCVGVTLFVALPVRVLVLFCFCLLLVVVVAVVVSTRCPLRHKSMPPSPTPLPPQRRMSFFGFHSIMSVPALDAINTAGAAVGVPLHLTPMPAHYTLYVYFFWRVMYNVVLGMMLRWQSETQFITRWVQATDARPTAVSRFATRSLQRTMRVATRDEVLAVQPQVRAWLLARYVINWALPCDAWAFVCVAFKHVDMENCDLTTTMCASVMFTTVVGAALIWGSINAKMSANRVLGAFAWFYGDYFFLLDVDVVFEGIYNMFPHPMYTVGYFWVYGEAVLRGCVCTVAGRGVGEGNVDVVVVGVAARCCPHFAVLHRHGHRRVDTFRPNVVPRCVCACVDVCVWRWLCWFTSPARRGAGLFETPHIEKTYGKAQTPSALSPNTRGKDPNSAWGWLVGWLGGLMVGWLVVVVVVVAVDVDVRGCHSTSSLTHVCACSLFDEKL